MKLAGHDAWYKFWRGTADTDFDEQGAIAVYLAMREAFEATPCGVKTEPTTEGAVDLSDARQKAWNAIAAAAWPAYGSRRASDRTPSTTPVPEKGTDAAAPRVSAPTGYVFARNDRRKSQRATGILGGTPVYHAAFGWNHDRRVAADRRKSEALVVFAPPGGRYIEIPGDPDGEYIKDRRKKPEFVASWTENSTSKGAAIGPDLAPQGAPPHFHRRYSDSIYGPPTRYEMWPHRRSTDE